MINPWLAVEPVTRRRRVIVADVKAATKIAL